MRSLALTLAALLALSAAGPAPAHGDDDADRVTREDVRAKREEIRDMEAELRRRELKRRPARRAPRAWIGVSYGLGSGSIDLCPDDAYADCSADGAFGLYGANLTLTGESQLLRLRAARPVNKGQNSRTPYEEAALIGTRLGRSDWYLSLGYGRVEHPDDRYPGNIEGLAYDVFYAPGSRTGTGVEISFRGIGAEDGAYGSVNFGLRFGRLR